MPSARASEPESATLTMDTRPAEWGGSFVAPAAVYPSGCDRNFCDSFALTIDIGERPAALTLEVEQPGSR